MRFGKVELIDCDGRNIVRTERIVGGLIAGKAQSCVVSARRQVSALVRKRSVPCRSYGNSFGIAFKYTGNHIVYYYIRRGIVCVIAAYIVYGQRDGSNGQSGGLCCFGHVVVGGSCGKRSGYFGRAGIGQSRAVRAAVTDRYLYAVRAGGQSAAYRYGLFRAVVFERSVFKRHARHIIIGFFHGDGVFVHTFICNVVVGVILVCGNGDGVIARVGDCNAVYARNRNIEVVGNITADKSAVLHSYVVRLSVVNAVKAALERYAGNGESCGSYSVYEELPFRNGIIAAVLGHRDKIAVRVERSYIFVGNLFRSGKGKFAAYFVSCRDINLIYGEGHFFTVVIARYVPFDSIPGEQALHRSLIAGCAVDCRDMRNIRIFFRGGRSNAQLLLLHFHDKRIFGAGCALPVVYKFHTVCKRYRGGISARVQRQIVFAQNAGIAFLHGIGDGIIAAFNGRARNSLQSKGEGLLLAVVGQCGGRCRPVHVFVQGQLNHIGRSRQSFGRVDEFCARVDAGGFQHGFAHGAVGQGENNHFVRIPCAGSAEYHIVRAVNRVEVCRHGVFKPFHRILNGVDVCSADCRVAVSPLLRVTWPILVTFEFLYISGINEYVAVIYRGIVIADRTVCLPAVTTIIIIIVCKQIVAGILIACTARAIELTVQRDGKVIDKSVYGYKRNRRHRSRSGHKHRNGGCKRRLVIVQGVTRQRTCAADNNIFHLDGSACAGSVCRLHYADNTAEELPFAGRIEFTVKVDSCAGDT